MPTKKAPPGVLLLGCLQSDTILTADGKPHLDLMGGNLLYAAAACRLAGGDPRLVARVGSDYPQEWLQKLAGRGLDTQGVRQIEAAEGMRRFIAYSDLYTRSIEHPVKHFARLELPLPKSLLGLDNKPAGLDPKRQRGPLSLRPEDLPKTAHKAKAAHLCPLDFLSHSVMPVVLREQGIRLITLESASGYMDTSFWGEFPQLVNGLTVFVTTEAHINALFRKQTMQLRQMMEMVASFNCSAVVVRSSVRGDWLYDAVANKHYHVPPFPARTYDLTDNGSSFSGALAAQLARGQDLVPALLTASAVASLACEDSGAFFVADTLPGLVEARRDALQMALREL